jgi:hypothetical protein
MDNFTFYIFRLLTTYVHDMSKISGILILTKSKTHQAAPGGPLVRLCCRVGPHKMHDKFQESSGNITTLLLSYQ